MFPLSTVQRMEYSVELVDEGKLLKVATEECCKELYVWGCVWRLQYVRALTD